MNEESWFFTVAGFFLVLGVCIGIIIGGHFKFWLDFARLVICS